MRPHTLLLQRAIVAPVAVMIAACSPRVTTLVEEGSTCSVPLPAVNLSGAPAVCANDALIQYDQLLVLAPHPDDEVLGFGGLIAAYLEQGKPVDVVVVTDGDAYCSACAFWKSGSMDGPMCDALDLSNFVTDEVDSFAEVRHAESRAAMDIVGAAEPKFLRYPDTGLGRAWRNRAQNADDYLTRSDFSGCNACGTCDSGYGAGPATSLTAATLEAEIAALISSTPPNALIATTHWLDGHGDHAALGNFVRTINEASAEPRSLAFAVIHAQTRKDQPYADCWYPGPTSPDCTFADQVCADENPGMLSALREFRLRPDWPGALPDDADYGSATHLCLPDRMVSGPEAVKLAAIESFASQAGFAAKDSSVPHGRGGMVDANGYLISFVSSTEAFVHVPRQ